AALGTQRETRGAMRGAVLACSAPAAARHVVRRSRETCGPLAAPQAVGRPAARHGLTLAAVARLTGQAEAARDSTRAARPDGGWILAHAAGVAAALARARRASAPASYARSAHGLRRASLVRRRALLARETVRAAVVRGRSGQAYSSRAAAGARGRTACGLPVRTAVIERAARPPGAAVERRDAREPEGRAVGAGLAGEATRRSARPCRASDGRAAPRGASRCRACGLRVTRVESGVDARVGHVHRRGVRRAVGERVALRGFVAPVTARALVAGGSGSAA